MNPESTTLGTGSEERDLFGNRGIAANGSKWLRKRAVRHFFIACENKTNGSKILRMSANVL